MHACLLPAAACQLHGNLPACLRAGLSACPCVCPSVCLSVCLSVGLKGSDSLMSTR